MFSIPLKDMELMTERKVLQGQCPVRLQRGEQRAEKDEYHTDYDIVESP